MSSDWARQNTEAPTVSVILPTYNRAHLVGRAIQSVLRQTWENLELIIVDDGSTDDTGEVVRDFKDERLRYLGYGHNTGAAAARNRGIRASRGRYVAFQDSDDEWMPRKLERQVKAFAEASPATGVVYTGFWRSRGNRKRYHPSTLRHLAGMIPSDFRRLQGNIHCALQRGNWVTMQAAMVRRECFDQVGGLDERLSRFQDWELWLRISKCYEFRYIHAPLVVVHSTLQSLSKSESACVESLARIVEKHYHGPEESIELLAHYCFAMGDIRSRQGKMREGQGYLFKAVELSPMNAAYWMAACASLCGQRVYSTVVGLFGLSYVA